MNQNRENKKLPEYQEKSTYIKEIILENFMSYDYARIPFKPGLNLISGPNGAGKSSILLALSLALGQSHTERSRKLSDLIRRGEEMARVSVIFDNSPTNGRRPIPNSDSDSYALSRYLKDDGNYWHEANYETVTKEEVKRILSQLSINPDNMLIVMHQGMIDVFGAIDAQERLKTVEEAVGLSEYRERIIEARENLSHKLSEEESINAMLEEAQSTLEHWEEEYERYKRKQKLIEKKEYLEREYAWAKWWRQKEKVENLKSRINNEKEELEEINIDLEKTEDKKENSKNEMDKIELEIDNIYRDIINQEKEKSEIQTKLEILRKLKDLDFSIPEEFSLDFEELEDNLNQIEEDIGETKSILVDKNQKKTKKREKYTDHRVREAILSFRRELLEEEISKLEKDLEDKKVDLEEFESEAKEKGSKIRTDRNSRDILEDIRVTNAKISNLEDVSADAEKMYKDQKELLEELKEKAEEAERNRKKALEELEIRKERWRNELQNLLGKVRDTYRQILERVKGVGDVRLIDPEDIDDAGLELSVGFRGAEPQTLDAYTQSGGERSTSIMCFLLALQQHIKSPIRALDEFELHMDPRNRQMMMKELLSLMDESNSQYIVITPGRLVEIEEVPNVIAIQNTAGSSEVKVTT
ncbi:hypothetical protein AKJ51_02005 [candidate division MSBL1 archaeon SCGC-AAA382A20]|uniref:RecF/RecN/SMC N-terminal domain-containing protein n=1 Tax=candidate division MSBL1 archaeon SCGC-AAA382A20 TaxID=1698280 RepID=A0A133VKX9_9EURY|nr:hypothetical protein AKJ51_02005 [candidate division MSBL1 archaeon SCGC-AAA382A20]